MKLDNILFNFSNYIQNNIFLTTIEMNNDYVIYKNIAVWKTNRSFIEK